MVSAVLNGFRCRGFHAGGVINISWWLTERDSAKMASPKAMARRAGYGRVPASAGGHIHNDEGETPPE